MRYRRKRGWPSLEDGGPSWGVGHPNGVESCQKSIGTIRCNLAISYNNWQCSLIFLDTTNKRMKRNACTKHYIEAHCYLKIENFSSNTKRCTSAKWSYLSLYIHRLPFKYYISPLCGGGRTHAYFAYLMGWGCSFIVKHKFGLNNSKDNFAPGRKKLFSQQSVIIVNCER